MAARMESRTIAHVTGVSQRTVNRVIRVKRLTGLVIRVPFAAGRPRLLNGIVLRHGRDVHPTWVKSSIETLSNTRVRGF